MWQAFSYRNTSVTKKQYLYKKVRTLFIPFLFFYVCFTAFKLLLNCISHKQIVTIAFFSTKNIDYPLWFLICLFEVMLLYLLISNKYRYYLLFLITAVGLFFLTTCQPLFYLTHACLVLPFVELGRLFYKKKSLLLNKPVLLFGFFITSVVLFVWAEWLDMRINLVDLQIRPNYFAFFAVALCGSLLTVIISNYLAKTKISNCLALLGEYSLFIFALHANNGFLDSTIRRFVESDYPFGIVKTIISLLLCLGIGYILNSKLPYFFQYRKKK